ncbi:hypothetical protein ACFLRM_04450 [Acidobacteriota bacterium]
MKKTTSIGIVLLFALFSFISCGKKTPSPKAGTASAEDILSMIPQDAKGVFFVDIHKAMSTEIASKAIEEDKNYQKYQEFIEKTGIDPKEDIYFLAAAATKDIGSENKTGVAIINLKYNADKLISLIKEEIKKEQGELIEKDYNGFTVYSTEKEDKKGAFVFVDASNIVAGIESDVLSVLDVLEKKKENMFKNEALSGLVAQTNKEAIFWGAMIIPSETMAKATSENPMLRSLESLKSASLFFDYQNNSIIAEIKALSDNEEKNKQVADLLNGIKAMGAMASAEKPEIGELMDRVEISYAADHVKISANIPEELVNKLKEMQQKKEIVEKP